MTAKELARTVIDAMPDAATIDDVMHALYIRAKVEKGEAEIRDGHSLTQEQVKQRFSKWLK